MGREGASNTVEQHLILNTSLETSIYEHIAAATRVLSQHSSWDYSPCRVCPYMEGINRCSTRLDAPLPPMAVHVMSPFTVQLCIYCYCFINPIVAGIVSLTL